MIPETMADQAAAAGYGGVENGKHQRQQYQKKRCFEQHQQIQLCAVGGKIMFYSEEMLFYAEF